MSSISVYEISVIPGKCSRLQVGRGAVRIIINEQEAVSQAVASHEGNVITMPCPASALPASG